MAATEAALAHDHGRAPTGDDVVPGRLTIAFTDLEGFTGYTEAVGDDDASRLLMDHHRDAAPIVRGRGGRIVKRLGDGLMLAFPTPEAAVLACIELRRSAPLPLRAGMHEGTVLLAGQDVMGRVVNLAARVAASARGGELLVTEQVRSAVASLPGVCFDGPHARRFKGIDEAVGVYLAS